MEDEALLRVPIFPLAGALLFPRAQLPLHIFEQRYRAMVRDALAGDRLIAMVQPKDGREPFRCSKSAA
jgi:Lon protease-like protein